ncbi:MAG: hypothetical protein M3458_23310 [Acidobacteriota bacterium]|nr:hypothetical protein [Acidobacteriota bacterium]
MCCPTNDILSPLRGLSRVGDTITTADAAGYSSAATTVAEIRHVPFL